MRIEQKELFSLKEPAMSAQLFSHPGTQLLSLQLN